MKRPMVFAAFAGLAVGVAVGVRRARGAKHASLSTLDAQFHAAYDRLRSDDARAAPVLVLFGDSLIAFEGERQQAWPATAPSTQLIKAAAHVPVGIFATLRNRADPEAAFDAFAAERLAAMRRLQVRALGTLDGLDTAARADVEQVLETSQRFLEQILSRGRAPAAELSRFAAAIGPLLMRLTEHATRLELAALHAAVEAALGELSGEQRDKLEVVVAGVHQARARSLGLQYFQKRFDEAPGEERRVTYAEAAVDARQARELIGTRRLDRKIALAFFGDAKKLQRDVLGDAAARQLERADLERLQPSSALQPLVD
jgi:hypothetical protein